MTNFSTISKARNYLFRAATALFTSTVAIAAALPSWAGSFVLTGYDSTYHITVGENETGAINFARSTLNFLTDPAYNTFVGNGINKFLFVESKQPPPPGHVITANTPTILGFTPGVDYEAHDASTLNAELDLLGTKYNSIVVPSDYGANFSQAELDVLNSRRDDITNFLNAGGGIVVGPQSNLGAGLTPRGGRYGFLPFDVPARVFAEVSTISPVTPFGASIGYTDADAADNATHVVFTEPFGGLQVAMTDEAGRILTVAGRVTVGDVLLPGPDEPGATVPEPSSLLGLVAVGAVGFGVLSKRK